MSRGLKDKRVFVAGASGFIGNRLCECLTRAYGVEVHALVRRVGTVGVARLARLPRVRLFAGDIRDADLVRKASDGCAHIIHAALATTGSRREQQAETIAGIRNVLEAAAHYRVESVVYFSTASVHNPARSTEVINEESPLNGAFPASIKVRAETLVAEWRRRSGVPVTVLRPTCVWGPFSPVWTVSAVELIQKGVPLLPPEGTGTANLVYVDNLVDAAILALVRREAANQAFLINDDEPRAWPDLYGAYADLVGRPLEFVTDSREIRQIVRVSLRNAGVILRKVVASESKVDLRTLRQIYDHVPIVKLLLSRLPAPVQERLRMHVGEREAAGEALTATGLGTSGLLPYGVMARSARELYCARARYANLKAKQVLEWRPRVAFDRALELTCQWLRYAGYAK